MSNRKLSEEEFFDILKKNNAYDEYINLSPENQKNVREIFMDKKYKLDNKIDNKYLKERFEKEYSEVKKMYKSVQTFIFVNRAVSVGVLLIALFNVLIRGNSFASQIIFVMVAMVFYMIGSFIANDTLIDIEILSCKCKDVERKLENL